MTDCWKISLPCTREEAETLSEDNFFIASADAVPTIVTREADPAAPNDWLIEVYCDQKPDPKVLRAIGKLAPKTKSKPVVEKLPDDDWVTMSQQGLKPLRAGRFFVHTSHDDPVDDRNIHNICIDASRAFGTGHHETTLGCLEALDRMRRQGRVFRNIIDVGTGTGLLAFAARHLWPSARVVASDIDPVAVEVSVDNAKVNDVPIGRRSGAILFLKSNGLDNTAIRRRAPFDLIIANILAGPLVSLAPQMAGAAAPGARLLLAGLLNEQKNDVVNAYTHAGFRLRQERIENDWPCLTLVKRRRYSRWKSRRRTKSPLAEDYFGEC